MAVLGLDIGTTGTKATIFDDAGVVLSYAYGEYDVIREKDGYYEIDPVKVWETAKDVIARANKGAGRTAIKALCTSSLGESFVMLDKTGKELAKSPIYMDKRGEVDCRELTETLGAEEIMRITGHPPHPMYSISKLMWRCKNDPQLMKKTKKILFYGDYILHKLGGQYISDYSLAARTMCFDITKKQWSEKIVESTGLDINIFPETQPTGSVAGEISPKVADELGIDHGIKLVLGGHDQIMAAIGAGVTKEGQAANGIGTVDCITPLFKDAKLSRDMMEFSYASIPYLFNDMFVTYAFNINGGSLIKWFRDTFASKDKELAKNNHVEIYDILNREMPKEPTDILILPHFAGSSTPNPDIHAKGAMFNLTLGTQRGEIYKACMEGEAFEMKYNIETLGKNGIAVEEMRTVGGGSRSAQWLQIRANIFNKKIAVMENEEAGTLGTAILAGIAAGYYHSVQEAANTLAKVKKYYYPDEKASLHYSERYEKYKTLYEMVKAIR